MLLRARTLASDHEFFFQKMNTAGEFQADDGQSFSRRRSCEPSFCREEGGGEGGGRGAWTAVGVVETPTHSPTHTPPTLARRVLL